MPIPSIRNDAATAARSIQHGGHAPAGAAQATPSSPEEARDSAISDISAARAQPRRARTTSWRRAAIQVGRTYEEGCSAGVHQLLRQNPDIMRAVATGPAEAIESLMSEDVGFLDGPNALSAVRSFVNGAVRDSVATHGQQTIRRSIRGAEALRTDILSNLEHFTSAPASSTEGQRMAELGLGSASTEADVNRVIDATIDGLEGLSNRFEGQAWELGDFPDSSRAALGRLRLRTHGAEQSVANGVIRATSGAAENAATTVIDIAHVALELPHIVHALGEGLVGAASLSVGVLAGGLALGLAIHHGAEEVRDEAINLANSLGIN